RFTGVVGLLGPALLAALVAIGTFADGQRLVIDARVLGVGAAAVALRFHAPVLLVVIIAAGVKAVVGAAGFEPATSASQTPRATRLRYAPRGESLPVDRAQPGGYAPAMA